MTRTVFEMLVASSLGALAACGNTNILYAIIGYQLYERRNSATIEINVGPGGVSIEKR